MLICLYITKVTHMAGATPRTTMSLIEWIEMGSKGETAVPEVTQFVNVESVGVV